MVGRILYTIFLEGQQSSLPNIGGSNPVLYVPQGKWGRSGFFWHHQGKPYIFHVHLQYRKKTVLGGDLNRLSRVPGMTSFEVTDSFWSNRLRLRSGEKKITTPMFSKGEKKAGRKEKA